MSVNVRESNMELLRIVAMIFIIIFHYVCNSNFYYTELTVHSLLVESCWFLGELGTNLFILIMGYYLCKSKISYKKVILIICEVLFYIVLSIIIGYLSGAIKILMYAPYKNYLISERYWFILVYLLIYILSPYFNKLISMFSKKEYQKFLIKILIIWCLIPTIYGFLYNGSEGLPFYNRFIWLSIMYFVGAYIRIYGFKFLELKRNSLVISILTFIFMILSILFINEFKEYFYKLGTTKLSYFWTPNNILMLILSISVFMFFTKIKIKNNKFINKIASTTLGIYLLHEGYISNYIWLNWFKTNVFIYNKYWYIYVFISSLLVFLVGFLIDIIRQVIEKYTIKKILELKIFKMKKSDC